MEQLNTTEQMHNFFHMGDKKYQASLAVNMQFLLMGTQELTEICQTFALQPVFAYLDTRTISDMQNANIRGFIRYMDTYLVEESGGRRAELIKLGKELTGQTYTAFSMRLIRLNIISGILSKIANTVGI